MVIRFDDKDCEAKVESGNVQELIRLFQGSGKKAKPAPAKKPQVTMQPRRNPMRRLRHAQPSPIKTRSTQGSGTVKIGGSLDDIKIKTDVALSGVPCIGAVRGSVRYEGDALIIDDARSASLGGRLRVSGRVRVDPSPYFEPVRVVATGVDLSKTCKIEPALAGKVSADVSLRGPPDPKRLTYTGWACSDRVVALGETLGDVAVWMNRAPGKLGCTSNAPVAASAGAVDSCLKTGSASGGRCIVARARREAGGEVSMAVHADKSQRLGGEVTLSRLPLAALTKLAGAAIPADAIIETSGLRLGGTLDAPTLDGTLRLSRAWAGGGYLGDGELVVRPEGAGRIRFSATFLDGRVAVSGTLGTRAPYPLELTADVQQVELDTFVDLAALGAPPGTQVWGSGRIQVRTALADPKAPLAVTLDLADLAIVGEAEGPDGQPTPLAIRAAAPLQLTWDGTTAVLTQPARLTTPLGEITVSGQASEAKLDLTATGSLDLVKAQPLLGEYFDRTTGTAVVQARLTGNRLELPRREVLRRTNPEWDLMARTFTVLAFANLAVQRPSERTRYLAAIDAVVNDSLAAAELDEHRFLLPYSRSAPFRDPVGGSLFVDGELALMLAARRMVAPDPRHEALLGRLVASIEGRLRRGPVRSGESYPDEAWMFCNTVALAAIALADETTGGDHRALFAGWVDAAREHLIDPRTGLLISSYTWDGAPLDGPEGSTLWLSAHMLQLIDEDLATQQYEGARRALGDGLLGFSWAREWPASWPGPDDIDSGPTVPVLGANAGSSGLALVGARAFGDADFAEGLLASLELAGFPMNDDEGLRYAAGNQLADAVILYALVSGPLWRLAGAGDEVAP